MSDDKLEEIKNRLQLRVECVCCCESVECLSDCTLADDSPEGYERLRADREATATHRAAVQQAFDLGRAEEAAEWAEEVKAEARECGCWERILRRRGEGEK